MAAITVEQPVPSAAVATRPAVRAWLVSPWFDVLFVANIAWPLLVLAQFGDGFGGRPALQFWQIYYVTTPHRWITLVLVFLDRDRFGQQRGAFLWIAVGVAAVCLSVRLTTGALTCLLAIDYVWNAWHFAAQHHGIYRVYGRLSEPRSPSSPIEKWALRGFLLYVTLRVVSATWSDESWEHGLRLADWFMLILPAGLVLSALTRSPFRAPGRLLYLVSVAGLYLSLLWAVHAAAGSGPCLGDGLGAVSRHRVPGPGDVVGTPAL